MPECGFFRQRAAAASKVHRRKRRNEEKELGSCRFFLKEMADNEAATV